MSLAWAGCTPGDTTIQTVFDPCRASVLLDADATSEQRAVVDQALAWWNDVAGLALARVEQPGSHTIRIHFADAALAFRGLYDDQTGWVWINRGLSDPRTESIVIAHELGHAFGLLHVPRHVRPSVMNPGNVTVPPTAGDAAQLHASWGACAQLRDASTPAP